MALTKVSTPAIKDEAITLAKLLHGDSNNNGKFLRANNGADPSFETVSTDLVADTSPQLGGDLASNGNNIKFADNDKAFFGTGNDFLIEHDGTDSILKATPPLVLRSNTLLLKNFDNSHSYVRCNNGGNVELYHNNSKKLETSDYGTWLGDNSRITLGGSPTTPDCHFYHDATDTNIQNITGDLIIKSNSGGAKAVVVKNAAAVELYHNNNKKFETLTSGSQTTGLAKFISGAGSQSADYNVLHVVAGGTATRGLMIGTGRATGAANNDGSAYFDAIDSESNGYGAQLQFRVDGTKVMVVGYNSNDNVGIGNLYPLKKLTVQADSNTHGLFITHDNDYDSGWGFQADSSSGHLRLDRSINNDFNYRRICFHGDGGIAFNGDTAAANALDDYEEGSFSVTLVGQYGGNASYSYRAGYYTRIGRVVHVVGDVRFDGSWSGNSGNVYLQLPFGTSFASGGTVGNGSVAEWNLSNSNWDYIGIQLDNNSANARFTTHSGSNNNTSSLQTGELGNQRYLKFGFTYITS